MMLAMDMWQLFALLHFRRLETNKSVIDEETGHKSKAGFNICRPGVVGISITDIRWPAKVLLFGTET